MAAKKYKMVDRKVTDLIPYVNNSRAARPDVYTSTIVKVGMKSYNPHGM